MSFRLVPKSVTLNDLERHNGRYFVDISRSALCCHSNETRASIANPSNSAQLGGGTRYTIPPSYIRVRPCSSTGMRRGTDTHTDRPTDTQTHRRPWPINISPRLRLTRNVIRSVWCKWPLQVVLLLTRWLIDWMRCVGAVVTRRSVVWSVS